MLGLIAASRSGRLVSTWKRCRGERTITSKTRWMSPSLPWPANVWAGATVEDSAHRYRADQLRQTGAAVKYLVLEPLVGPVDALDLTGIGWVILGGESGPGARAMHGDWVRSVR